MMKLSLTLTATMAELVYASNLLATGHAGAARRIRSLALIIHWP